MGLNFIEQSPIRIFQLNRLAKSLPIFSLHSGVPSPWLMARPTSIALPRRERHARRPRPPRHLKRPTAIAAGIASRALFSGFGRGQTILTRRENIKLKNIEL